jgi:protein-disulfide isomerase
VSGAPPPPSGGPDSPNRRTQLIVLAVLAVIILAAAIVISQSGSDDSDSGTDSTNAAEQQVKDSVEGIPQEGVFLGEEGAVETVAEFVDLQCPFCAEFSRNAFPDVIDENVRSGDVRYELRVISFLGEDSGEAAEMAAAAALQNKLYEFAETFYLNQGEENSGYVTEEFLREVGEKTPGLDVEQALADRSSPEAQALISENEARATELKVNSTPSFVLIPQGGEPTALQLSDLTASDFSSAIESARGG